MPWTLPNMKHFYLLLKKGKLKSRICEALKFTDRKTNNLTLKTKESEQKIRTEPSLVENMEKLEL